MKCSKPLAKEKSHESEMDSNTPAIAVIGALIYTQPPAVAGKQAAKAQIGQPAPDFKRKAIPKALLSRGVFGLHGPPEADHACP